MNAAEIAREYLETSNQRIEDDDTAADITDADVHVLCHAVLDAEAYKKRVEGVALHMTVMCDVMEGWVPRISVREWAAQLTETPK